MWIVKFGVCIECWLVIVCGLLLFVVCVIGVSVSVWELYLLLLFLVEFMNDFVVVLLVLVCFSFRSIYIMNIVGIEVLFCIRFEIVVLVNFGDVFVFYCKEFVCCGW